MASHLFQNYFLAVDCHTCRLISWSLHKSPVIAIKCTLMTFHFFFHMRAWSAKGCLQNSNNWFELLWFISIDRTWPSQSVLQASFFQLIVDQFSGLVFSFNYWRHSFSCITFFDQFCWSNSLSFRYYSSSCMCVFFDHLYMWPFRSVVVDIWSIVPKIPSFVRVTSSNSCAYYAISFIRDFFDQLCLIFHNWVVFYFLYFSGVTKLRNLRNLYIFFKKKWFF